MEEPLQCRPDTSEPARKRRRKRRRRCKRHPNEGPHSPSCRGSSVRARSNAGCLVRILPSLKPVLDYLHVNEDVFTREQIMGHLTEYIKQKALYDPDDPRKVYCQNDELSRIFGCKEFSTANACQLLLQNLETVPMTDSCSCSETDQSVGETSTSGHYSQTLTDTTPGSKRQRTTSSCSDVGNSSNQFPEQSCYAFYFSPFRPGFHSDDNGEFFVHYNRVRDNPTDVVTDTSDDLFFLNETDDDAVVVTQPDEFPEEYEPITFSDEERLISLRRQFGTEEEAEESTASFETEIDEGEDGGDELDDNEDSDSEIEEEDRWKCEWCAERNHPMTRNCRKCWNVRKDWYPSALERSMSDPTQSTTTETQQTDEAAGSDTASTSHSISQINTNSNEVAKCVICLKDPPNGCIIHGQTGHQVCCVGCAKKLKESGRPCPVCRKKIHRVITNFM